MEPGGEKDPRRTGTRCARAWRTLLLNQFHDILTGSCTHEVAERAKRRPAGRARRGAAGSRRGARGPSRRGGGRTPGRRRGGAGPVEWLNLSGSPRREVDRGGGPARLVRAAPWSAGSPGHDGRPGHGGGVARRGLRPRQRGAPGGRRRRRRRPLALRRRHRPRGPRRPRRASAATSTSPTSGTPGTSTRTPSRARHPLPPAASVLGDRRDDLRVELEVVRDLGGGDRAVQTFRLDAESPCLEIDHAVDWSQRHRLLRFEVPTGIVADAATFEIPFGVLRRADPREHAGRRGPVRGARPALRRPLRQRLRRLADRRLQVRLLGPRAARSASRCSAGRPTPTPTATWATTASGSGCTRTPGPGTSRTAWTSPRR